MSFLASMPPARRRIWEASLRAGIHDPEARGRAQPSECAATTTFVEMEPGDVPSDRASAVLADVATKRRLRISDITSRSHGAPIARARHEAAYRLHVEEGLTFKEVGELIIRSYTSAMHGAHGHAARYRLPSPIRGAGL